MAEINGAWQEDQGPLAELDCTDQQCLCCPRCQSGDIEPMDGCASWDVGRFWECKDCGFAFEVRHVVREVGPVAEWV